MWLSVPRIINVLEKPITELRSPGVDLKWAVMAYFSHFAMGFLLGWLVSELILFVCRFFKNSASIGNPDPARIEGESPTFFERARDWIERIFLGGALIGDRFYFTLRVGFWSAMVANLIDFLDHWPMLYGGPDRLLHPPGFVVSVFIVIYCGWRIIREKDKLQIRRYVFWLCPALSVIAHVLEDYLIGWF